HGLGWAALLLGALLALGLALEEGASGPWPLRWLRTQVLLLGAWVLLRCGSLGSAERFGRSLLGLEPGRPEPWRFGAHRDDLAALAVGLALCLGWGAWLERGAWRRWGRARVEAWQDWGLLPLLVLALAAAALRAAPAFFLDRL